VCLCACICNGQGSCDEAAHTSPTCQGYISGTWSMYNRSGPSAAAANTPMWCAWHCPPVRRGEFSGGCCQWPMPHRATTQMHMRWGVSMGAYLGFAGSCSARMRSQPGYVLRQLHLPAASVCGIFRVHCLCVKAVLPGVHVVDACDQAWLPACTNCTWR
jgi:hypothetical protein